MYTYPAMRGLIILGIALRRVINFMNIESSTGQRLQIRLVKLLDVEVVNSNWTQRGYILDK